MSICQNYQMNIKKTQEFVYFQNKARHYANLRQARPAVKTHRATISHSPASQSSHIPYFKRYDLQRQNQGLINRITQIMTGPKIQVQKQGYTRYNYRFIPKSHLTIEQKKQEQTIDEGNHQLAHKVLNVKPSIGTIQGWGRHFSINQERRSNISKYTDKRTSKGTISIYQSNKFVPQHYRSFLNQSLQKQAREQDEESPQELNVNPKLRVQQLFQLPKLKRLRGSLTRIGDNGQLLQQF